MISTFMQVQARGWLESRAITIRSHVIFSSLDPAYSWPPYPLMQTQAHDNHIRISEVHYIPFFYRPLFHEDREFVIDSLMTTGTATVGQSSEICSCSQSIMKKIDLIGVTGAGKSTTAQLLMTEINRHSEQSGLSVKCLIISADKWSKQNRNPRTEILQELIEFENVVAQVKVVIFDICNDRGITKNTFGYDFEDYDHATFAPNLDCSDLIGYECACLLSVLNRQPSTSSSPYWLTKYSGGVKKAIEIHNIKASGVFKFLNLKRENGPFEEIEDETHIRSIISERGISYRERHPISELTSEISRFVAANFN